MDLVERPLRPIWDQQDIPVVLRRDGRKQKIRLRLPYSSDNRQWLKSIGRSHPDWNEYGKYWEIPKSWFNDFVDSALKKFGALYVIQPYRERQTCARACMEATGHICECSCMGAHHGSGFEGRWFEISEAFAVQWGDRRLACRLMVLRRSKATPLEVWLTAP